MEVHCLANVIVQPPNMALLHVGIGNSWTTTVLSVENAGGHGVGRPRDRAKGATSEANALAEWLQRLTAGLTLEQLSEQLPYGKSKWGRYLNGQDLVPEWLLEKAVAQRMGEPKLRSLRLAEGRALLQAAEEAAHKPVPERMPEATLAELSLRLDEARKGQLEAQATLFATVRNRQGVACGALSVSGPARRTDAKLALLSGAVIAAATELGTRLG